MKPIIAYALVALLCPVFFFIGSDVGFERAVVRLSFAQSRIDALRLSILQRLIRESSLEGQDQAVEDELHRQIENTEAEAALIMSEYENMTINDWPLSMAEGEFMKDQSDISKRLRASMVQND